MHVGHGVKQTLHDGLGVLLRVLAHLQQRVKQHRALQQIHHDVALAEVDEVLLDLDDVGMVQLGHQADFVVDDLLKGELVRLVLVLVSVLVIRLRLVRLVVQHRLADLHDLDRELFARGQLGAHPHDGVPARAQSVPQGVLLVKRAEYALERVPLLAYLLQAGGGVCAPHGARHPPGLELGVRLRPLAGSGQGLERARRLLRNQRRQVLALSRKLIHLRNLLWRSFELSHHG
mmetsp:Transcript_21608/g.41222  ORF Transcript_21608/g.41222 Transcript_21608/m.41222 type:complete len:232 (+) Transcript_21608:2589-3284(+)